MESPCAHHRQHMTRSLSVPQLITTALTLGVPAFNQGDHQGCYEVYADAARSILASPSRMPPKTASLLACALEEAQEPPAPSDKAWTLRRALDAVMEDDRMTSVVVDAGGMSAREPTSSADSEGSAPREGSRVLVDFTDAQTAACWQPVDDRIMGGSSLSQMRFQGGAVGESPDGKVGAETRFQGRLITEGGGFASARCNTPLRVSPEDTLQLTVRGDGRQGYKLTLRTALSDLSYQCPVDAPAARFDKIELPLSDFRAVVRGRPVPEAPPLAAVLSRSDTVQAGLMLSRYKASGGEESRAEAGEFVLRLQALEATRAGGKDVEAATL